MLVSYACNPLTSRGRLVKEADDPYRNEFHRDRDRIVSSACFRRLAYKTQVFVNHEGDHYRTRLTHSLEVAQIARVIANKLQICEELAECLALAHDLGHAPFGHAGEDALNKVMGDFGGFNHNAQTIKIITKLEQRYANFDGLNLTWETLEGVVKHNGPLSGKFAINKKIPLYIKEFNDVFCLELDKFPSLEAQVAAISDDIAYNNHDIEDAFRAEILELDDIMSIEILAKAVENVEKSHGYLPKQRLIFEATRFVIRQMITDVLDNTKLNIKQQKINTIDDVRNAGMMIVDFSESFAKFNYQIKEMLRSKVYNHFRVNRMTNKAKRVVRELFKLFMDDPTCLPNNWKAMINAKSSEKEIAVIICDFIAGMSDRFAIREHKSFYDLSLHNSQIHY